MRTISKKKYMAVLPLLLMFGEPGEQIAVFGMLSLSHSQKNMNQK